MTRWRSHAIAVTWALIIGVPCWMVLFDRKWPYTEFKIDIDTPEVRPGGTLRFALTGVVNRHCGGLVRRQFIDAEGKVHTIESIHPALAGEVGKPYRLQRAVTVPSSIAPGPAEYQGWPAYQCNPLQWLWPVQIKTTRVPFTVTADGAVMSRRRWLAAFPSPH